MTIRGLEIFTEVCKHMNMSKAAQSLLVSQSSVSQAIAALEKEYDVQLFERLNHSLYLTPAGRQMLYLASQVLRDVEQLERRMKDASSQNPLNIGVCTTVGECLIHPLLEKFEELDRDSRVVVEINNSRTLERKILTARLDLAVVQRTRLSPYLCHVPVLEDRLLVVCWNGHPLAGKTVRLRDLQEEVFIGREKGSGTKILLENAFAQHGGAPLKTSWVCNSIQTVKQAVLHRAGIAILSRFLVQKDLDAHRLEQILVEDVPFTRQFDLIYHRDKIQDAHFREFVALCEELGKEGMERLIEASSGSIWDRAPASDD